MQIASAPAAPTTASSPRDLMAAEPGTTLATAEGYRRLFLLSFRRTSFVHQKALALRRSPHYALCSIAT